MAKVMVVNHDAHMRETLYDSLTAAKHTVVTVGSGQQTIELLKVQRPTLVVLNLTLPGISGVEIARRIREFDQEIPILLTLEAGEEAPSADVLKELAISGVVQKEDPGQVMGRIQALLGQTKTAPARKGGLAGSLLVIDDDPQVQSLLKMFFESKGMRVTTVGSGEEGLKAAERNATLIMLDVNMPGMDGVLTLKKLKAAKPNVPVVVMSGGGEKEMAQSALKLGAYDYISKPFNLEYLETVVLTKVLVGLEA